MKSKNMPKAAYWVHSKKLHYLEILEKMVLLYGEKESCISIMMH